MVDQAAVEDLAPGLFSGLDLDPSAARLLGRWCWHGDLQYPVAEASIHLFWLYSFRQVEAAVEAAVAPLAAVGALPLSAFLPLLPSLPVDGEAVAFDLHLNVVLVQTRQVGPDHQLVPPPE